MKTYLFILLFLSSHLFAGECSRSEVSDDAETITEYMEDLNESS